MRPSSIYRTLQSLGFAIVVSHTAWSSAMKVSRSRLDLRLPSPSSMASSARESGRVPGRFHSPSKAYPELCM